MDFYFTNRSFNLCEIISTGGTTLEITDEQDVLSIDNGNRTLSGTIYFSKDKSQRIRNAAAIGNYVLYHDLSENDIWMTIVETEHDPLNGTHTFVAEDAGLDLLNELLGPYKATKAMTIAEYINKFAFDSGFEIGFNEIPNLSRKLEWESDGETALARIVSVATQFDNAEINFSFDVSGTTVIKKYINIYRRRGKEKNQTLYVNVDLNNIKVTSDIYDLGTAIYAVGGTLEGQNTPVTLKGYKWKDPEGRYELTESSGILKDKEAGAKWSRMLQGQLNSNGAYIVRRKTYETTNKKTLLNNALRELKTIAEPAVNFEIDVSLLPENVQIGDTINLVDEEEEIYLSARVLQLVYMYSANTHTAIMGDYLIKNSGVSDRLVDLANQLEAEKNRKTYTINLIPTTMQFVDGTGSAKIECKVFDSTLDVTTNFSEFTWTRYDKNGTQDTEWRATTNVITVYPDDEPIWTYQCDVEKEVEDDE